MSSITVIHWWSANMVCGLPADGSLAHSVPYMFIHSTFEVVPAKGPTLDNMASTGRRVKRSHTVCALLQGDRGAAAAAADAAEPLVVPEDIGRAAAQLLLEEVSRGGVTDGTHQGLLLLMAALGPEEMNEVRLTGVLFG